MIYVPRLITLTCCFLLAFSLLGCAVTGPNTNANDNDSQLISSNSADQGQADAKPQAPAPRKETRISSENLYKLLVAEISAQRSNNLDISIDNYLEVAKESKDVSAVARAAQMAAYAEDNKRALEANKIWVDLAPNDADAHRSFAAVLLRVGREADSIPHFKKLVELSGDQPGKGFGLVASQLVRVPDRSVAQAVMEQVIDKYHHVPEAMFAYGHLLLRLAKFDEAAKALDSALDLRKDWSNAVILKARILALGKGRDEAIKFLKSALDGNMEDNFDVGRSYARLLTENAQFEDAFEQTSKLAKMAPRDEEIHYLAGVLALRISNLDKAKEFLLKVVKLGKRLSESNYYLGQIAEIEKDYATAIDRYSSVKHGDMYFNAQIRVVALLSQEKRFENAKSYIRTVRPNSDKQQLQLHLLEGDIMREAGEYNEAKQFYTQLLGDSPHETSIRYARALIAEKLGELDLLESDLTTILKNEPKNAQVLNALGYTLADRTNRYDEALAYIQRAMDLEPNDAAVMDSMGWVHYRMGNYNDALAHLTKANSMDEDPEIAAHYGEVLWVMGKKKQAQKIWEESLLKNPDHQILLNVMKRFGL